MWAKPREKPRPRRGRASALEPRCVPAVWVGVHEDTGENVVIAEDAPGAAFRVRTVARRPAGERWDRDIALRVVATPRIPDPRAKGRADLPTPKQARILQGDGAEVDESGDDDEEDPQESPEDARDRCAGDAAG